MQKIKATHQKGVNIMKNVFIYLSGSIKKSHDVHKDKLDYWTDMEMTELKAHFGAKGYNVVFLNPASRSDDLSDELSLFGRDMLQVYLSDVVLADMRGKRGIGIGYEVAFANFKKIPVVSWSLEGTYYRPHETELVGQKLTHWTHPFVSQTSKQVVNTLEEATNAIIDAISSKDKLSISKDDFPYNAIQHYLATQLIQDLEMKEMISTYPELSGQVDSIHSHDSTPQ